MPKNNYLSYIVSKADTNSMAFAARISDALPTTSPESIYWHCAIDFEATERDAYHLSAKRY
ncbi:hypothetical protein BDFG_06836 [Blastomyces dermatitidis ATCC 26199]|nr:hypothetical protein BDFG_06836 [Blastomyces dermatitidis ATCC 26199]